MPKTTQVDVTATTITFTREPDADNVPDIINNETIVSVHGIYNKKPDTIEIPHGTVTGAYTVGETITGGTSAATGILIGFKGTGTIILNNITGTFISGETLTGGTSAAVSTATAAPTPMLNAGEWTYPYAAMTILNLEMNDGSSVSIELQEVSNQVTWSTGTLAGVKAAEAAIKAVI